MSSVVIASGLGLLIWPMTYQAIGVPVAWIVTVAVFKAPSRPAWWIRGALLFLLGRFASDVTRYLFTSDTDLITAAPAISAILPFVVVAGDELAAAWQRRRRSGASEDKNPSTASQADDAWSWPF